MKKWKIFGSISVILVIALLALNFDFRSPRKKFRDMYGFDLPLAATNIVYEDTHEDYLTRIRFHLPPHEIQSFVTTPLPGYEGWREENGYTEIAEADIRRNGHFYTNEGGPRPSVIYQMIVVDMDANEVTAVDVNMTGF